MKCHRKCRRCNGNNGSGGSIMLWGNFTLNGQPTTEYLDPGYSGTQANLAPNVPQYRAPTSGTFRNLFLRQVPNTGGNVVDITYRLRKNNVATDLVVVLSSAATDANITANVDVEEGDLLDFEVVHDDFGIVNPTLVVASLKFTS